MTDSKHSSPLLQVRDLSVAVAQGQGAKSLVRDLSFDIPAGKTVALVGESGSGKSLTALSIMRLLPDAVQVTNGDVLLRGQSFFGLPRKRLRKIHAKKIELFFQ